MPQMGGKVSGPPRKVAARKARLPWVERMRGRASKVAGRGDDAGAGDTGARLGVEGAHLDAGADGLDDGAQSSVPSPGGLASCAALTKRRLGEPQPGAPPVPPPVPPLAAVRRVAARGDDLVLVEPEAPLAPRGGERERAEEEGSERERSGPEHVGLPDEGLCQKWKVRLAPPGPARSTGGGTAPVSRRLHHG